jgi:hypothetical protein
VLALRGTSCRRAALVGRDDRAALCGLDAVLQRLGGEAAEHHRVNGTDARAGQHGVGRLGNHRHIQADAVTTADAARAEGVAEAADFLVQFPA